MENKIKIELNLTEKELNWLYECVVTVSQITWNGVNTQVEPIKNAIKAQINAIIQRRIDTLKSEILKLEGTKHE